MFIDSFRGILFLNQQFNSAVPEMTIEYMYCSVFTLRVRRLHVPMHGKRFAFRKNTQSCTRKVCFRWKSMTCYSQFTHAQWTWFSLDNVMCTNAVIRKYRHRWSRWSAACGWRWLVDFSRPSPSESRGSDICIICRILRWARHPSNTPHRFVNIIWLCMHSTLATLCWLLMGPRLSRGECCIW